MGDNQIGMLSSLRDPGIPIPKEIAAITGIDDAMVCGQIIPFEDVASFAATATIIIAHNAAFDRPFAERLFEPLKQKAWACSMSEIDWRAEGLEGRGLKALLTEFGLFFDGHRALADCEATLGLLVQRLPKTGDLALSRLLSRAREPTLRIWATASPFEAKDILKRRGYRWNGGEDGRPKSWYFDARPLAADTEIAFLRDEIYRRPFTPRIDRLTAFDRFREGA